MPQPQRLLCSMPKPPLKLSTPYSSPKFPRRIPAARHLQPQTRRNSSRLRPRRSAHPRFIVHRSIVHTRSIVQHRSIVHQSLRRPPLSPCDHASRPRHVIMLAALDLWSRFPPSPCDHASFLLLFFKHHRAIVCHRSIVLHRSIVINRHVILATSTLFHVRNASPLIVPRTSTRSDVSPTRTTTSRVGCLSSSKDFVS